MPSESKKLMKARQLQRRQQAASARASRGGDAVCSNPNDDGQETPPSSAPLPDASSRCLDPARNPATSRQSAVSGSAPDALPTPHSLQIPPTQEAVEDDFEASTSLAGVSAAGEDCEGIFGDYGDYGDFAENWSDSDVEGVSRSDGDRSDQDWRDTASSRTVCRRGGAASEKKRAAESTKKRMTDEEIDALLESVTATRVGPRRLPIIQRLVQAVGERRICDMSLRERQAVSSQSTAAARGEAAVLLALCHFLYPDETQGACVDNATPGDREGHSVSEPTSGDQSMFIFLESRFGRLIPVNACWRLAGPLTSDAGTLSGDREGGNGPPCSTQNRTGDEAASAEENKREDVLSHHSGHHSQRTAHGLKWTPPEGSVVSGVSSFPSTAKASGGSTPSQRRGPLTKDAETELILLLQALQILCWSLTDRELSNWTQGPGGVAWRCGASVLLNTTTVQSSNLLLPFPVKTEASTPRSLVPGGRIGVAEKPGEAHVDARSTFSLSASTAVCRQSYGQQFASLSAPPDAGRPQSLLSPSSTARNASEASPSNPPSVASSVASQGRQKEAFSDFGPIFIARLGVGDRVLDVKNTSRIQAQSRFSRSRKVAGTGSSPRKLGSYIGTNNGKQNTQLRLSTLTADAVV
ncbi:hypothetical protein NCLIV_068280 [Neospora caninum Liverpool]|uniref:Uncharacterized protein n=1 Tax=Neospora caninum (strain Liverpool) TaxID=572307 RepID=F0VRQ6_NEOCL|nr:hypothetical protein NCLIV_068280 [Neospora caninum Liverpool]CBZ56404.1 hypothetical protein NCLIV_068280 [Neospora caninum Liverpool]CEL71164.1 TPA: hypothetical protein BN1204_068280 [Neospora caninum Liverpool]|eukprot:XP_003886429.1 hypothetical protein NCLIV_068280 [Neospora caninum Liverpool]